MIGHTKQKRKQDQELGEKPPSQFLRLLGNNPSEFVVNLVNNLYIPGLDAPPQAATAPSPPALSTKRSPKPSATNPWVYQTQRHVVVNRNHGLSDLIPVPLSFGQN